MIFQKNSYKGISPYLPMSAYAFKYSRNFGLLALAFVILYALGEASGAMVFLKILGTITLISLASFAVGGIIGFLFGIPHTVSGNTPTSISAPAAAAVPPAVPANGSGTAATPAAGTAGISTSVTNASVVHIIPQSNYAPSTNLEQIADWLTKIFVGVGLTQIHKIIILFNQLCYSLADSLAPVLPKGQNAVPVVGTLIIVFLIDGFLIVYLWTYLYLIQIQDSLVDKIMDNIHSQLQETDDNNKVAIDMASTQLTLSENAPDMAVDDLVAAFTKASGNVISSIFYKTVTFRKENWRTAATKAKMERVIPIFRALIKLDRGFEFPENLVQLGFALKDKRQPDYKSAYDVLTQAIVGLNAKDSMNHRAITYFNRAFCLIKMDAEYAKGLPSKDDNRAMILSDLQEAAKEGTIAGIIATDKDITGWQTLNKL